MRNGVINANELVGGLGARLKAIRLERGLSQSALAAGLASKSMMSQIESGKSRPSRELLERFAERLEVALEELLPAMEDDQQRHADFRQAQALYMLDHYDQALPLLLRCLEAPLATWSIRLLHMQTAFCCQALKRYEQAREHYEVALRDAVREQAKAEVVRCLYRLGEVAFARGDWSVALHEWQLALRELQESEPPEDEPGLAYEVQLNLGKVYYRLGDAKNALRHYREAYRVLRGGNHPLRKEAEAMFGIGKSCFRLKRYRVAHQYLCGAIQQYDLARDRRSALKARLERVQLLRVIGERALAMQLLDECEQAARDLQDAEIGVRIVCERAVIWQEQGRREKAVEGVSQALRFWYQQSWDGKGVLHLRLAELHAEGELYEAALREAECAAAALAEEGDQRELLKTYQLLTRLHKLLGDYKRASECVVQVNELMNRQIYGVGLLA